MASAANESHATSSGASADDENWKYVECAKCREAAVVQDKQDPNMHVIRADFQLTACGHVACEKCLEVSKGEDGSQTCPKCRLPLQDWISILNAQSNPTLNIYFQSVETMLTQLASALKFQTSNLRDQAAFYKDIATKQSAALKATKKELAELRSMRKAYEALQRENTALKGQLSSGNTSGQFPQIQQAMQDVRQGQQPEPIPLREGLVAHHGNARDPAPNQVHRVHQEGNEQAYNAMPTRQDSRSDMMQEHGQRRSSDLSRPLESLKRNADHAELGMPQITLPPRLRESDLPANAMSSAHKYDDRLEGDIDHADEVAHGDTLAYIAQFRSHTGDRGIQQQINRSASKQSNNRTRSPRETHSYTYGRRSSSRGSRSDLPAIEEAPFKRDAISGEAAPISHGQQQQRHYHIDHTHRHEQLRPVHEHRQDAQQMRPDSYHRQSDFVQASVLQLPEPAYHHASSDVESRPTSFRPLMAKHKDQTIQPPQYQPLQSLRQAREDHISPPSVLQRSSTLYGGTARPATAQAGSTSQQQYSYVRPSQQNITRPSTSQASRSFQSSSSRLIRPMAIPPNTANNRASGGSGNGNVFKFQPERR